jgi:sterol desaturase/sphingolipid hydroxylase (fatty acid hydroxylase superfamily)
MSRYWAEQFFKLTRNEYFADFLITPPLTLLLAYSSLHHGFTALWPLLFVLGVFVWTLYEYALHRWVLHVVSFFKEVHDLHHKVPKDYIAVHPLVTLAIYIGLWKLFGFQSSAFGVGFSAGYVAYSVIHTISHYYADGDSVFFYLWRRHALHHTFNNVNYGVTTSLWDRVFGTEF